MPNSTDFKDGSPGKLCHKGSDEEKEEKGNGDAIQDCILEMKNNNESDETENGELSRRKLHILLDFLATKRKCMVIYIVLGLLLCNILFTLVEHLDLQSFMGLLTETLDKEGERRIKF